jgi:hypothetical protein
MSGLQRDAADRPQTAVDFGEALIDAAEAGLSADWLEQSGIVVHLAGALARARREATPSPGRAEAGGDRPVVVTEDSDVPRTSLIVSNEPVRLVPLAEIIEEELVPTVFFIVEIAEPGAAPRRISVREELEIGRDASGIRIADPEASRHHLRIEPSPGGLVVTDLGSTNGTRVNGKALKNPAACREGDVVEFGKSKITVVSRERRMVPATARSDADEPPEGEHADDETKLEIAVPEAGEESSWWRRRRNC